MKQPCAARLASGADVKALFQSASAAAVRAAGADLALGDGQAATVTLTAVRNAWGISGAVVSVGGSPLAGAVVEACQGSGAAAIVLDSSATDELGEYRIGNLKPGVAYQIRVRLDGRVVGAHPAAQQVPAKDIHLGILPYKAAPLASATSSAAAGTQLSDEGLDWKAPVMVLLLLAAGSATVFKPTIIDILQLRAPLSAPATATRVGQLALLQHPGRVPAAGQTGRLALHLARSCCGGSSCSTASCRGWATAAAAEAAAAAAAGLKNSSEWLDDNEMRGMGMKQRGASSARRTRRA
ncbi:hypothetical protein COO60DRAFT_1703943 [Scenedesmus sp. NREL 46B-D3]|nr:hypothetical protein COO60DRAFT_1703943 [Scenedesmus sp. NREL 46B-D3]